jgi:hypothetical protein
MCDQAEANRRYNTFKQKMAHLIDTHGNPIEIRDNNHKQYLINQAHEAYQYYIEYFMKPKELTYAEKTLLFPLAGHFPSRAAQAAAGTVSPRTPLLNLAGGRARHRRRTFRKRN